LLLCRWTQSCLLVSLYEEWLFLTITFQPTVANNNCTPEWPSTECTGTCRRIQYSIGQSNIFSRRVEGISRLCARKGIVCEVDALRIAPAASWSYQSTRSCQYLRHALWSLARLTNALAGLRQASVAHWRHGLGSFEAQSRVSQRQSSPYSNIHHQPSTSCLSGISGPKQSSTDTLLMVDPTTPTVVPAYRRNGSLQSCEPCRKRQSTHLAT
jgi:hypothetical protein